MTSQLIIDILIIKSCLLTNVHTTCNCHLTIYGSFENRNMNKPALVK